MPVAPTLNLGGPTSHGMATKDQENGTLPEFFPSKVASEKESSSVVKKLTAISISTVLYHRNMFPESDYGQRNHLDLTLHILDKKAQTPEARRVVSLVQSLFKPIDEKYLKSVILGFCEDPNEPNDVIEAYFLHLQYFNGEVSVTKTAKNQSPTTISLGDADIGESAANAISRLKELCSSQDSLENRKVYMTLQLQYNDNTPQDYEPEGFSAGTTTEFTSDGDVRSHKCGQVTTKFHGFKLKARLPEKEN